MSVEVSARRAFARPAGLARPLIRQCYSGTPLSISLHFASTNTNAPLSGLRSQEMTFPSSSEFFMTLPLKAVNPLKNRTED